MNASSCLGSRCGTNIDSDNMTFSAPKSNLVYIDKVYSYNKVESCPLLLALTTTPTTYTATLSANDPCCACGDGCGVDSTSSFVVTNAYAIPEQFLLNGTLTSSQVTVNGLAVDSISGENGQYVASTANLIGQIQRNCCMEYGLPTKTFFLASAVGPWAIRLRIVVEGTVTTGGKNCCFKAEFVNNAGTFVALPDTSVSNFAIPKLSLPCSTNGVAPTIRFQFGAMAQILNPTLTVDSTATPGASVSSSLVLGGTLVITPTMSAEVIRKSLFCITACEAMLPCDGTEEALAIAQDDDGDTCDPFAPDCACGSSTVPVSNTPVNTPEIRCGGSCGGSCGCGQTVSDSCGGGCGCPSCGGPQTAPGNTIITRSGNCQSTCMSL